VQSTIAMEDAAIANPDLVADWQAPMLRQDVTLLHHMYVHNASKFLSIEPDAYDAPSEQINDKDESMHSKLDTRPTSEQSTDGAVGTKGSQAAEQQIIFSNRSMSAEMAPAQLVMMGGVSVDAPEDDKLLPGMIAREHAHSFKRVMQVEDNHESPSASSGSHHWSRGLLSGQQQVEWKPSGAGKEIADDYESDDETQDPTLDSYKRPGRRGSLVSHSTSQQRTHHAPPILITEQRRLERNLRPKAAIELQRVHFRLPKAKRSWFICEPLESSAKAVRIWSRCLLLPIVWEVWAFPFRLAFCDVEQNEARFVYHVDIFCDVWLGLGVLGDFVSARETRVERDCVTDVAVLHAHTQVEWCIFFLS
jgi:hypothetical protein